MPLSQEINNSGTLHLTVHDQTFSILASLRTSICWGALALLTATALAQETAKPESSAPPPAATTVPTPETAPPTKLEKVSGAALYNLLQEKSIVFPDIALNTERLSPGQKFQIFVDNSISVHTVTWAMLGSAVGQADDSPTGFGEGWDAYAKRFGSSMGRQASSEFFGTFVLASALHEDPRFYAEVNPKFMHAVKYSVQRVFVTRNDDGRDVINWSGLVGPAMAEGLANVYWPEQNRTVGDTFFRYGLDLATRAGGNMLREYWPVFYGKIRRAPRPSGGNN